MKLLRYGRLQLFDVVRNVNFCENLDVRQWEMFDKESREEAVAFLFKESDRFSHSSAQLEVLKRLKKAVDAVSFMAQVPLSRS